MREIDGNVLVIIHVLTSELGTGAAEETAEADGQ